MLEELTSVYPAQTFIRSDNGPEFIAHALRVWYEASDTTSTMRQIRDGRVCTRSAIGKLSCDHKFLG